MDIILIAYFFTGPNKLIGSHWRYKATLNLVNINSGNIVLPDSTKSLPKPILADHQWGREAISQESD